MADILASHFQDIDSLRSASVEALAATPDVGDVIAQSVRDFLSSERGWSEVEALRAEGVVLTAKQSATNAADSDAFCDLTFVVTGTLSTLSREQAHELIQRHGGKTGASVSGKTDFLVAGEKAGSKLVKAEKLGVTVLTEEDFLAKVASVTTESKEVPSSVIQATQGRDVQSPAMILRQSDARPNT